MVVYCAGFPAIYGHQPLYFENETFYGASKDSTTKEERRPFAMKRFLNGFAATATALLIVIVGTTIAGARFNVHEFCDGTLLDSTRCAGKERSRIF